jgi:hypothetical protein
MRQSFNCNTDILLYYAGIPTARRRKQARSLGAQYNGGGGKEGNDIRIRMGIK